MRGLNGEPMQYLFYPNKKGPRVRIHKELLKNGELVNVEMEINIFHLMAAKFGSYFPGHALAKAHPGEYMLVPKDGNWSNLHRKNLHYVEKKEYREQGTKRALIKMRFTMRPEISDQELSEKTGVSRPYVYRVRQELIQAGKLEAHAQLEQLRQLTGILISEKMLPVYVFFMQHGGELSNLEIAKQLFPDAYAQAQTNAQKKVLTAEIVRVRKRLTDCGLLLPSLLSQKRDEAIKMLREKSES